MNPEPFILPPPTPITTYLKWTVGILVLVGIYFLLRPYFPLFVKIMEVTKLSILYMLNKTSQLEKADSEADIGKKLTVHKEEKPPPKPEEAHFCYAGEWDGIRHCVQVEKSQCSSKSYSTLSQCVNPS